MKKFAAAFCLISTSLITPCLAENSPQPNQPVTQIHTQSTLDSRTSNSSTAPTSDVNTQATSAPEPTGEGAKNQPAPNQQTAPQSTAEFDAMTTDPTPPLPPLPLLPPATAPTSNAAPINTPPAAPVLPTPDHSDAPAAAQLPAGVTPPEPPNPDVTKLKVSAQKNLDSMGHNIGAQIRACWKIPKSSIGGAPLTAVIFIDKTGVLSLSEFTTKPTDKQAELADSVKTAVAQCSPLKNLPPEARYEEWKNILIKFNPNHAHKAATKRAPASPPQQQ